MTLTVTSHVVITGGDGYLGSALARRLAQSGVDAITVWVRCRDRAEQDAKRARLEPRPGRLGSRIALAFGDLRQAKPFAGLEPNAVTHIVHCAALTRFNVESADALAVNVEGTRRVLEFARACPKLRHFAFISTLYAAGLRTGEVREEPLQGHVDFANHYESSKHAAEAAVLSATKLPTSVLRVATLIADDGTGRVSRCNAVHNTLRMFLHGLVPVLPGCASTPIYLATRELAATAVTRVLLAAPPGSIYHVAPDAADAITLGEMIDAAYEVFLEDDRFRNARILPPLLCDLAAFGEIANGLRRFAGPVLRDAIASIAPFAPQLFSAKAFRNERLRACLGAWADPGGRRLIAGACRDLLAGRRGQP